jgi:Glyoxalase/Bleomycin resistance protein/Dioxygenase superfamily
MIADTKVFTIICGTAPEWSNGHNGDRKTARFWMQNTFLDLVEIDKNTTSDKFSYRPGFDHLELSCPNFSTTINALLEIGIAATEQSTCLGIPLSKTNNVQVRLRKATSSKNTLNKAHARIDHVAIVVSDLIYSSKCWAIITDNQQTTIERHPLGNFEAARLKLGDQMVELVGSIPNVESSVSTRLKKTGEGVITVAIVAEDLQNTASQLKSVGVRLIEQGPHLMVHPKDSCGVLIQLTPRLNH